MDQQFSLSWNNFHGNLSEGFAGLLGKKEFVDVTIAVEGHLIQAHKVILSICSPYFKEMFHTSPCQHPIVVLRDVSHKIMKDLLQFMYIGEVSVKREDLTSFIGTAELLQIKGLTNKENDEACEIEQDLTNHRTETQNSIPSSNSGTDIPDDINDNQLEDQTNHVVLDLLKQREFADRLQRLSNLKRKSEEFIHKNYYNTEIFNFDKKPKLREKLAKHKNSNMHSNHYEQFRSLFHTSPTFATNYSMLKSNSQKNNNENETLPEPTVSPESLDIKAECDDGDIIVTEPSACISPKGYDVRESQKDMECQSTQDNRSGEHSLYTEPHDALVNGKGSESYEGGSEHQLVTIPQRDGKKKYPQRSCRLCWRLGRRRDTRFMCSLCQIPLCKLPCFVMHLETFQTEPQLNATQTCNFPLKRM